MLLLGIGLFFKGRKSYWIIVVIDFLLSLWLFANILYYREFSNFLSFSIIKASGSTSDNLGKSIVGITRATDFLSFLDVATVIVLLLTKVIRIDVRPVKIRFGLLIESLAILLMGVNLGMAQKNRSGLLTRTFDNNYIVKYLGINEYAVYDGFKTAQTNAQMAKANVSDLHSVEQYLKTNYVQPNPEYTGVAKGKNVLVIHLESFQQFLIGYKWKGKEVTPNLNKIYHAKDTLSFDNFYNQVGQGKTSDAEMMLENSLFGLQSGSAMSSYGTSNTFESAPAILRQRAGYTTAVMHGGAGSFWNRNNAYKSFGYQYFMPLSYYKNRPKYYIGYGLKDKIFFDQSVKYIERLPQPFYLKLIDPDADRMGACVRTENGDFQVLTGNQIATLMAYYLLVNLKQSGKLSKDYEIVTSVVSSALPFKIAKDFGVKTKYVLTGFKYIGEEVDRMNKTHDGKFLMGFEESYGYLFKPFARDKDAMQGALMFAEVATYYASRGMTVFDGLKEIWQKYGVAYEITDAIPMPGIGGQKKMAELMTKLRNEHLTKINGAKVIKAQDFLKQETFINGQSTPLKGFPKSNVLKYFLDDETWVALRPSGTEPVIKAYVGVNRENIDVAKKAAEDYQKALAALLK